MLACGFLDYSVYVTLYLLNYCVKNLDARTAAYFPLMDTTSHEVNALAICGGIWLIFIVAASVNQPI